MKHSESEEIDRSNSEEYWTKETLVLEITKIQMALKEKSSLRLKDKKPLYLLKNMQNRFEQFDDRYPALLRLVVTQGDNLNQHRLAEMLNMYEKVRINQVKEFDASVKIGSDLYNEYVKPNIE